MALSSVINRIDYAGNGITTAFSFPYYFLKNDDLTVILVDSDGVETTQTLTTNYTVSGAGVQAGGTVTMIVPPATGETLVIFRDPGLEQELDLVENDSLPAEETEKAFDKLTMIAQRNRDLLDRTLRFSDGFTGVFDPSLPADITTPNVSFISNSTGTAFTIGPTADQIANAQTDAVSAAASAAAAAASAAAAAADVANAISSAELNDIGDVNAPSPLDGQVLTWDDGASEWQPKKASGGGGGSLRFIDGSPAPIEQVLNDIRVYSYSSAITQNLHVNIKLSDNYVSGSPVKLRALVYSSDSSGTVLLRAQSTLIRTGTDAVDSTTNQRTTTNTAITLSASTVDQPQLVVLDISSNSGEINSVAISPGDLIKVRIYRDTDTATGDLQFMPDLTELTLI